ncbi:MAG: hypothetical protein QOE82_694 [Thermoanaerobaculia bacterium]|jgi:hypothetical protein|nr:hypothetical protein [Thermoanaerobaculia bacterium]
MLDNTIVILSFVVLLPLVPAFLLFKLLPSRAVVKGPLAGLNVNLGGAFGGYVALTVFVTTVASNASMLKPPKAPDPVWHVRGTIQLEQEDGSVDQNIKFKLLPPAKEYTAEIDKSFAVDIPMADRAPIPHFYFTAKGYVGERVDLADPGRPGNYKSHMENATTLVFDDPIVLRKAASPQNNTLQANMAGGG